MKKTKMLLTMLLLALAATGFAGTPMLGDALAKGAMPENGKMYYIYADTYKNDNYINRYLYNNSGTLAMNTGVNETDDNYVWLCAVSGDKYTFQNVGDNTKYLGHKALDTSAYNFTLGKAAATHAGTTIWSDAADRYLVAKNDGTTFDQANKTYNQATEDWCTDYVFVEYKEPTGKALSIETNIPGAGEVIVNGVAAPLPYNKWEEAIEFPVKITAKAINPYKFLGFFKGEDNVGDEIEVTSLEENVSYEARFQINLFSTADDLVPVRIYSNRNNAYCIRMNAKDNYENAAVNSGVGAYGENEIWYLVGDAESFKLYNKVAGTELALTLAGTASGSAATLSKSGTDLCLVKQDDGSYGICPKGTDGQSFNMYAGNGNDIKLYATSDAGSKWLLKVISPNPLTLNYNKQLEGAYEQNYKIGNLSININGSESSSMLTTTTIPESSKCYLPEGAVFGIAASDILYGWKVDINGKNEITDQTIPAEGLEVNVNISVDKDNKYQYLYYSPDEKGIPYRIPAIATTANGYVFAINDYRPCGSDIGYGEVDLVMRHSVAAGEAWDGHSWTEPVKIADGLGNAATETWKVGYGDPAIVADREKNEILVMSVCGNRTCWDGNYGVGGDAENPNRVSRIRIKFDEARQEWIVGEPEEVTYDIYPLFKDKNGYAHVRSMFIGAGRIAQSSKIKVGDYYRIYCAVWAVETGKSTHHNYAIYSDDFGETWNVLGEIGYENCPSKYGNEPKCEELPDGSVLLSSRKGNGRYFNVFRYTDAEKGEGAWMGEVDTNVVGDLKWGSNSTNGEPLLVGNVLLQSAPTGNDRRDVALFYKILSNDPADYTPTKLSNGWTKVQISYKESAYSSMCILPGGEEIGFFYEEVPGGYSMVYVPLRLKDFLSEEAYNAMSKGELFTAMVKTEELIAESRKESEEIALQASDANEKYYVSTNADQNTGGGGKDGDGIAALVDNSTSTFFHTRWGGAIVNEPHYIQIDMGDDTSISKFQFSYVPRNGSPAPTAIKVYGSDNADSFTEVIAAIESGLPAHDSGNNYVSDIYDNSYRYLRFTVTNSAGPGNNNYGGQYFFGMLEFDLMVKKEITDEVLAAIADAEAAVAQAKKELVAEQTDEEYAASVKAIEDARKALLAAIEENEGTTSIESAAAEESVSVFDLTGRKIEKIAAPGIYVVNGKKVYIR
ncbi:MAG: discoidin domain-containing protein [Bacteroidaceae bacterium]|nr:discoidin domain-containing protein [Bacteroidaceae bacterium]